jgi:murein DD-endopeptidase MepM/ murein hydrolase activator NlpD
MNSDSSFTWNQMIDVVREVGEEHNEPWERWIRKAKATAYVRKPELLDKPYSGPDIESWPLSPSEDSEKRRAEILKRLRKKRGKKDKPAGFKFESWPTEFKSVSQKFGVNRERYGPKFPGHEGIDVHAPENTRYFAVADGTVGEIRPSTGKKPAYGTFVRINHVDGYSTLYAHAVADPLPPVRKGQAIKAGDVVAISGNTGNSSGPHLHLTLKKIDHEEPGWGKKPGYMDPGPFLVKLLRRLEPRVKTCFIDESHLKMKPGSSKAITNPGGLTTNIRDKASPRDRHVICWVPKGTLVRRLSEKPENGFYKCEILEF